MHDYQKILTKIHQAGAELVAVSPTTPDNSLNMAQKNALDFEVLSDVGNQAAKKYGIVYKLPESIRQYYRKGGMIDLSKYNDDDSLELPLAATYIVDRDGIIRYAFLSADYRKRAETAVVLKEVQRIAEGE